MTLQGLIQGSYIEPPTAALIEKAAAELNMPINALLDGFAREVAMGYMAGKYTWEFGDIVMNNLHSCAYVFSDLCLPNFARQVFEAFDEGEYIHTGEPPELDGEPRTKALLAHLMGAPSA